MRLISDIARDRPGWCRNPRASPESALRNSSRPSVLLARAAGLPARVVVGFRAGDRTGDVRQVQPVDGLAWAEVNFDGLGWLAYDPTPTPGDQPPPPELPEEDAKDDGSESDRDAGAGPNPLDDDDEPRPADGQSKSDLQRTMLTVVATVGVLVGVLAAAATAVLYRRRSRRRRRETEADPAQRVLGAWRQCLDDLQDLGVRPALSSSAGDCVELAVNVLGPPGEEEAGPLAVLLNEALFGGAIDPGRADLAWRRADRLAVLAAERRSRWQRITRALDVRVLLPG